MDNNNVTVQANLDTTQLRKDLDKFKGEISLSANTKEMQKQIDNALKTASQKANISLKCAAPGLQKISSQVESARSQIQSLQNDFNALPQNINLDISVNSSGLKQYASQLEQLVQSSKNLTKISLPSNISPPAPPPASVISSTNTAAGSSLFDSAISKGKEFLNVTNETASVMKTPLTWFGPGGLTEAYPKMFDNMKKNLD